MRVETTRFWQSALDSGLVDADRLEFALASISPERRTADAIERRLARELVQAHVLTLWQAQQLLRGRGKGLRIGPYVLLNLIGRGGMGTVYLVRDHDSRRLSALKALSRRRDERHPHARVRFNREIQIGAQLRHPNLVHIHDDGEAFGYRYLVMDYVDGPAVSQLITELGCLPSPVAAGIGLQVSRGMEEMHRRGFLHRDIKPNNLLINRDGVAKLSDLGLAFDVNIPDALTRDGATLGTMLYVSPEQARNSRSIDIRSDIYSLGCTLYQMISGRVPFVCMTMPELVLAHQLTPPEPLSAVAPGCPAGLSEAVGRMLAKDPAQRPASPTEVIELLRPHAVEKLELGTILPNFFPPHLDSHSSAEAATPVSSAALPVASPAEKRLFIAEWFKPTVPDPDLADVPLPVEEAGTVSDLGDCFPREDSEPDVFLTDAEQGSGPISAVRPGFPIRLAVAVAGLVGLGAVAAVIAYNWL